MSETSTLTFNKLKEMPPHAVIASGVTHDPRLYKDPVRWVAKRGYIHDWTIYYHHEHHSEDYVKTSGDKCFTHDVIKELVPCDEEAFQMYRF
jgi:hypothetical protein